MKPISVWVVFGTRPEAIKMLPLVKALRNDSRFSPTVCVTGQHQEILQQVMDVFDVTADISLNVMREGQGLTALTTRIMTEMDRVLSAPEAFGVETPDRILVHGDTTTTFAASMAAYYHQIPVGHVEAGLRTNDLYSPYPEEGNRQLTRVLADQHYAPTEQAMTNLVAERVSLSDIECTGNTVIDALLWMQQELADKPKLAGPVKSLVDDLKSHYDGYLLVTGHRRESHGQGFERICSALKSLAEQYPDRAIVYPVHPNPNVREPVERALSNLGNVYLIKPQDYAPFIYLMMNSDLILTDSGGIQEEAPSLGKPVLVMRDVTERQEAVDAGTVKLVGTDEYRIVQAVTELLTSRDAYLSMAGRSNPYGDGNACAKILSAIISKHRQQ